MAQVRQRTEGKTSPAEWEKNKTDDLYLKGYGAAALFPRGWSYGHDEAIGVKISRKE